MKNLLMLLSSAMLALGLSSCCSMFGAKTFTAGWHKETQRVQACGYDIIREEVVIPGDSKSGLGRSVRVVEKKVPRYKTVTKHVWNGCGRCVQVYCPKKDCCGTTSESTRVMSSAQGWSGSPNLGLVPTMKPIAP